MRAVTTTLSLVGDIDEETFPALASVAANISVEPAPSDNDEELLAAWKRAQSRTAIYTVVGFDPLQQLVDQWAESLAGGEPIVFGLAAIEVPDYYLVDLSLGEPRLSWYLQLLFDLAPQRIITVEATVDELYRTIADLPYGAALPTSRALEQAAGRFVPTPGLHAAFASSL